MAELHAAKGVRVASERSDDAGDPSLERGIGVKTRADALGRDA